MKETKLENTPEIFTNINNITLYTSDLLNKWDESYDQKDYKNALKLALKMDRIRINSIPINDELNIQILVVLYNSYKLNNLSEKSLDVAIEILEKEGEINGILSRSYVSSVGNLTATLLDLNKNELGLKTGLYALELSSELNDDVSGDEYSIYNSIGLAYTGLENYTDAIENFEKSIEIRKKIFGEKSDEYFLALSNFSHLYSDIGQYDKAKSNYLKIIEFYKSKKIIDSVQIAFTMHNYIQVSLDEKWYFDEPISETTAANFITHYNEILATFKKNLGNNSDYYTLALISLHDFLIDIESDNIAEGFSYEKIKNEVANELFSIKNEKYFYRIQKSKIDHFYNKGQPGEALNLCREVLENLKDTNNADTNIYQALFRKAGLFYYYLHDDRAAYYLSNNYNFMLNKYFDNEKLLDENSLKILYDDLLDEFQHLFEYKPNSQFIFNNWSFLKGRDFILKSEFYKRIYNSENQKIQNLYEDYLSSNSVIASQSENLIKKNKLSIESEIDYSGKIERLLKNLLEDKTISNKNDGKNLGLVGDIINKKASNDLDRHYGISSKYENLGLLKMSITELEKALTNYSNNPNLYFELAQLSEKDNNMDKALFYMNKAINLESDNYSFYNARGIVFAKKNKINKAIRDFKYALRLNSNLADVYNNLGILYSRSNNYKKSLDSYNAALEINPSEFSALENRAILNRNLGNFTDANKDFNELTKNDISYHYQIGVTYQDMGKNELAVKEFLKQAEKESNLIFEENDIVTFEQIENNLNEGELYIDIIKGLFDSADLELGEESYYAFIIEKGSDEPDFVYLNSEKKINTSFDFLKYNINQKMEVSPLIYENLFGELIRYFKKYKKIYYSPDGLFNLINPDVLNDGSVYLNDKFNFIRVLNTKDFIRQKEKTFENLTTNKNAVLIGNPTFNLKTKINSKKIDLKGTQNEINTIEKILNHNGWNTKVFTQINATEENLKNVRNPDILHIATHGYFLDQNITSLGYNSLNPLSYSGLLLAGSENNRLNGVSEYSNGIFNGHEASLLNLKDTDLVVLSACETGMGVVQDGKGIYGLQRAFQIAGAKSIIMSLWKIDDEITSLFMTLFYDNWINQGLSKVEAFNKSKNIIKLKYRFPYYWGAFVLIGN